MGWGDYSVVVTDANGCQGTSNVIHVMTFDTDPTIYMDGPIDFCEGDSVQLGMTAGYDSYLWNTGETTNSLMVHESGIYQCTATFGGCTVSTIELPVDVFPNPEPVIVADGPLEFCLGESVNLSVTEPFDSYLWSDGETTSAVNIMGWGDYSVVVTDVNGCQGTSNIISVMTWGVPVVSISASGTTICYEGSVTLTATSTDPVQWKRDGADIPGATDLNYIADIPGHYTCMATNGACSAESGVIKLKYADRINTTPAGTVALCGPFVVLSVPAAPATTYQWYEKTVPIAGATSNAYSATAPGKYHCFVTKAGCTRVSKLITVTPCRSADEYIQMDVYPNPASNSFTVTYSVTDPGKIILSVLDITGKEMISLGTERQSGTWDEQFSTDDLASGLYIVTLQDAAGNIRQQKIVIEK